MSGWSYRGPFYVGNGTLPYEACQGRGEPANCTGHFLVAAAVNVHGGIRSCPSDVGVAGENGWIESAASFGWPNKCAYDILDFGWAGQLSGAYPQHAYGGPTKCRREDMHVGAIEFFYRAAPVDQCAAFVEHAPWNATLAAVEFKASAPLPPSATWRHYRIELGRSTWVRLTVAYRNKQGAVCASFHDIKYRCYPMGEFLHPSYAPAPPALPPFP